MLLLFFGWCGTFLYLTNHGYISLVTNWRPSIYFGGNLLAATALTVQSLSLMSWQAAIVNCFWMVISALLLMGVKIDSVKVNVKHYFVFSCFVLITVWLSALLIDLQLFFHVLAWSSAYFFCSSYFLFSAKRISSRHYLAINVYAALALLPQLWLSANYPVFALEIAWAMVSMLGIIKSYDDVHLID